jgi:hypothetical protein
MRGQVVRVLVEADWSDCRGLEKDKKGREIVCRGRLIACRVSLRGHVQAVKMLEEAVRMAILNRP